MTIQDLCKVSMAQAAFHHDVFLVWQGLLNKRLFSSTLQKEPFPKFPIFGMLSKKIYDTRHVKVMLFLLGW